MIKKILLACSLLFITTTLIADTPYGADLTEASSVRISELTANPEPYVDKWVKIEGLVDDVCPMKGCWADIIQGQSEHKIRIKVQDGVVVFPVQAKGKRVIAEGILRKIQLSKAQAIARMRHEAQEKNQQFDVASVTQGMTIYQIEGRGAVIKDS